MNYNKKQLYIEYDGIIYLINEEKYTAELASCLSIYDEIIIPEYIYNGTKEYLITNICKGSFINSSVKLILFEDSSQVQAIEDFSFAQSNIEAIIIPPSVTRIGQNSFCLCENLREIRIPNNSQLRTIEENAFKMTSIERFTFPSNLVELKEGWCCSTKKLNKIDVSPDNPYFKVYDNKFIIGKSSIEKENYDQLVFCFRNVENVIIPSFIEYICSYAFDRCNCIRYFEIPVDSKLKAIGNYAFSFSSIEKIIIPSQVYRIGKGAFNFSHIKTIDFPIDSKLQTIEAYLFNKSLIENIKIPSNVTFIDQFAFSKCQNLNLVDFPDDSKLQAIESDAFYYSNINCITIPSSLIELKEGWCHFTTHLTEINLSSDNSYYKIYDDKLIIGKSSLEKENYDKLVFCFRNVEEVTIPSFIEIICGYAFEWCKIKSIKIPSDSKIKVIEQNAFFNSLIEEITIPSQVTIIKSEAFAYCKQLKRIEIAKDSKLKTIEGKVLKYSTIESISIPSNLVELKRGWCNETVKLTKISISPNNQRYFFMENKFLLEKSSKEQKEYDNLVFCVRDAKTANIPSFINYICPYSFEFCIQLKEVKFSNDAKLKIIDEYAFYETSVETISIPSQLENIEQYAFAFCRQLKQIDIPIDSNLQNIGNHAFENSSIERIFIPSKITNIKEGLFISCQNLKRVDIPIDSEIQIIESYAFSFTSICSFVVPLKVTKIEKDAFFSCHFFQIIELNNFVHIDIDCFELVKDLVVMVPVE